MSAARAAAAGRAPAAAAEADSVGRAGRREPNSAGHAPPTDRQREEASNRAGRKNERTGGTRPGGLDKARGNGRVWL